MAPFSGRKANRPTETYCRCENARDDAGVLEFVTGARWPIHERPHRGGLAVDGITIFALVPPSDFDSGPDETGPAGYHARAAITNIAVIRPPAKMAPTRMPTQNPAQKFGLTKGNASLTCSNHLVRYAAQAKRKNATNPHCRNRLSFGQVCSSEANQRLHSRSDLPDCH